MLGKTDVKPVLDTKGMPVLTARDTIAKKAINGKPVLVPKFTRGTVLDDDDLNGHVAVKVRFNTLPDVGSREVFITENAVLIPIFAQRP